MKFLISVNGSSVRWEKEVDCFFAPTHTLEPEVPYENIEAYLKAVEMYGKY